LPEAFAEQRGLIADHAEYVHLGYLVPPPPADDHFRGKFPVTHEPRGMFPACAFKHSPDVLLQALLGPALDGVALAALDKVHVITEDAEPEGKIRIGDLVQRVSRWSVQRVSHCAPSRSSWW